MTCRQSPVIVIGMHRSGTSLVARMLEGLGLFMGDIREYNEEAHFFLFRDRWLLSQCGASWEHPEGIRDLLENAEVRALTVDYLDRYLLRSPRIISYLGWKQYLRYGSPFELARPWGWKCPLSTYTLPIWMDLFPTAKVVHVYRHGVDVANSLRQRALRTFAAAHRQGLYYKLPVLHALRPKTGGFMQGLRCATLEGGLSLWEEYFAVARGHVQRLGGHALELKYEDLIQAPTTGLKRLAEFCGLDVNEGRLLRVGAQVRKQRAYAYAGVPELKLFAERVADRLAAQNY
jgi:hypothetical protein